MLRVSKVEERLNQPPARLASAPLAGATALGMHLVMIPPGTRGRPHFHAGHEIALCMVSGETEVWHGEGLVRRSTIRAGEFIRIPPGAPHLAVNRGDVISIAVAARGDRADRGSSVVMELPRHLSGLLSLPVVLQD